MGGVFVSICALFSLLVVTFANVFSATVFSVVASLSVPVSFVVVLSALAASAAGDFVAVLSVGALFALVSAA